RYQLQGTATKVVKYLEISPTTQCISCQKFSHIGDRNHSYSTYIIQCKPYQHTTLFTINCKEKHFANSKDCKTLKAAKLVREGNSIEE
ncbi:uncharacterized protein K441DRAFT_589060, partial [Cenococcum geophilum 1.58]